MRGPPIVDWLLRLEYAAMELGRRWARFRGRATPKCPRCGAALVKSGRLLHCLTCDPGLAS